MMRIKRISRMIVIRRRPESIRKFSDNKSQGWENEMKVGNQKNQDYHDIFPQNPEIPAGSNDSWDAVRRTTQSNIRYHNYQPQKNEELKQQLDQNNQYQQQTYDQRTRFPSQEQNTPIKNDPNWDFESWQNKQQPQQQQYEQRNWLEDTNRVSPQYQQYQQQHEQSRFEDESRIPPYYQEQFNRSNRFPFGDQNSPMTNESNESEMQYGGNRAENQWNPFENRQNQQDQQWRNERDQRDLRYGEQIERRNQFDDMSQSEQRRFSKSR